MKNSITSCLNILILLLLFSFSVAASVTKQGDAIETLWKRKAVGKCKDSVEATKVGLKSAGRFINGPILVAQNGSKEEDKIEILPGQMKKARFSQFGGYITVDEDLGRNLFYYFVEAVDSFSKPLLLWLNGGPGCSSLIGAMQEIGPFRVKSDGKTLFTNPFAWNKVANVLFLESPAGVGFSYSGDDSDYVTGDQSTAEDGLVFLMNWLERFPEYKGRDFYIAGESYGGHYVPQLAAFITRANRVNSVKLINLKGISIGNPLLNDKLDGEGYFDYLYSHAIISDEMVESIHKNCTFDNFDFVYMEDTNPNCNQPVGVVNSIINELDIYNIYAPLCHNSTVTSTAKEASIRNFDPCSDVYLENYMNLPEVQEALHANVTKINFHWVQCSNMAFTWTDSPRDMLPVLNELLDAHIKILVFSGDFDARIPVTSTRNSISSLNLKVLNPWEAWRANEEVGGFKVDYAKNFTFATVRGAGHMVPSYQPFRSLKLIRSFINGTPPN